ncbi:MAG: hypothetical protein IKE91_04010 [Clostridia bacterium]|nr:hypothetical protein [Clostridia bacterium]
MILQDYFSEEQLDLCREVGIVIEERDYNSEELYELEQTILDYIYQNVAEDNFYMLEEKFDEILDIIMDLENEEDDTNPFQEEYHENDHVELNNGKTGIIVDITNNVYTVEVDEKFKTGNLDEDVMIVAENSIVKLV